MDDTRPALLPKTVRLLGSSLVCLQARSVRCEPDEVDEQKARRRIRRYVENFLRVQRSLAMQIALRSVKILMNSLVTTTSNMRIFLSDRPRPPHGTSWLPTPHTSRAAISQTSALKFSTSRKSRWMVGLTALVQ